MPHCEPVNLVWFKRDLRVADHAPLREAARRGAVLCLYVYEPEVYGAETFSGAHLELLNQSLLSLEAELAARGGRLVFRVGEMPAVLEALHRDLPLAALYAHEETGDWASFERDRRVRAWARSRGVPFYEFPSAGVVRGARLPPPARLVAPAAVPAERFRTPWELGLAPSPQNLPTAGEAAARAALESFLTVRGRGYLGGISSPERALRYASRLSPYLALGNLSVRQVFAASARRRLELRAHLGAGSRFERALLAFETRLRWRDAFIQKLEWYPRTEFENLNRGFDGMREGLPEVLARERLEAFAAGRTGYPMVDACMRALQAGGWLNFRMRALLVSFACYHLWLDWRPVGRLLARGWLDYEPGIHWPQLQMQSGVTGVHAPRIYSPAKQARDHDPTGAFIRRWVPELAGLPTHDLAEPWAAPPLVQTMLGCVVGKHYPAPIVDPKAAYAEARRTLGAWRARDEVRREAARLRAENGWEEVPTRPSA
ncbi:FAD-binding domain-containing protein [Truepera radiovictrix]|uniref:DNA photolyase FAD-binding protein n=1 Tax=Truepera radiovictrix (strain DSM 17093 / CIP 108686 / LMG 22925 / RQ-24) TaxID=649638 RepID=D7CSG2_TRURR|nr:FAD-binding domain-containing protein [Truepera radiovictrix]ADI15382.1 DNA photolyase FAD-binding protein [Truepera radiovictrix DSM 17093]WMT56067.1 FAD-binding domain-containing protein [Truepera radiovictrix]